MFCSFQLDGRLESRCLTSKWDARTLVELEKLRIAREKEQERIDRADARGRGIGRRLMVALHGSARAAGVKRMALSAEQDNDVARRLYRSLGYVDLAPADPKDRMVLDFD